MNGAMTSYSSDEMMAVAAARRLRDGSVCFVGIGLPSKAANLARATHAPACVLIYESGCIGAKPVHLPLSIGVGFLGAAQIDRFGNLNSTVVGPDYDHPKVRLPGAGGAPEIAASCHETFVMLRQTPRAFVQRLDFRTSVGHGDGPGFRARLGLPGAGVTVVVTDMGVLEPDPETCELMLTSLHPGVHLDDAVAATAWPLQVASDLATSEPPTERELTALRSLKTAVEAAASR
jgi:glutaconate CoA-transferase, subunit B